jgi:hypothetical protein
MQLRNLIKPTIFILFLLCVISVVIGTSRTVYDGVVTDIDSPELHCCRANYCFTLVNDICSNIKDPEALVDVDGVILEQVVINDTNK